MNKRTSSDLGITYSRSQPKKKKKKIINQWDSLHAIYIEMSSSYTWCNSCKVTFFTPQIYKRSNG